MSAKKYLELNNGQLAQRQATVQSTGNANDGDLIALDATGKIDVSVLPLGVVPTVSVVEASENLIAGNYVNIFSDMGTAKVRKADSALNRTAQGYVKSTFNAGQLAVVYFKGTNDLLSGMTPGARQYLGTAGNRTQTVPTFPSALFLQFLGVAISATALETAIADAVGLS